MKRRAAPQTLPYGPYPGQEADLHLPEERAAPVVCLLHGGFWRAPHGRDQLAALAADLLSRGYAVWNVSYRRLGEAGGGYPGTLEDAAAAVDRLAELGAAGVDLGRVVVVGHSAGGQLALWAAASTKRVRPLAAAGLAPIVDLAAASAMGLGRGAVRELLGGGPGEVPERYAAASPRARLPLGVPHLLLHGALDEAVPIGPSREYVAAARAAGDAVELVELESCGHMDFLDPQSAAHRALLGWLVRVCGRPTKS